MLKRLKIKNYALIESICLEFGQGLNVITGETGAGKSILVDALGLALGRKSNGDAIRTGENQAEVVAVFECDDNLSSSVNNGKAELHIRRVVSRNGRSTCFVNGHKTTISSLRNMVRDMVDIHGQHGQQSLLDTARHLEFLDTFGGLGTQKELVASGYHLIKQLQGKLSGLIKEKKNSADRRNLIKFQVEEIEAAKIEPNEDEILTKEHSRLENSERLMEICATLEMLLYEGDNSVAELLGNAASQISEMYQADTSLKPRLEEANDLLFTCENLARYLGKHGQNIERNPERLVDVADRLDFLNRIKKKYGGDLQNVISFLDSAKKEIKTEKSIEKEIEKLQRKVKESIAKFSTDCLRLSKKRQSFARKASLAIVGHLKNLGMPDSRFNISLSRNTDPKGVVIDGGVKYSATEEGIESGSFQISTNQGEDLRPLASVASGGELSRILLAMKSVLSLQNSVQVLIFDEIDTGISGRIADVVGKRLRALSNSFQTISVTHLPQIARMADQHISVSKQTNRGRTKVEVNVLDMEGRVRELAQLIGGEAISDLTIQHAKEMLKQN